MLWTTKTNDKFISLNIVQKLPKENILPSLLDMMVKQTIY